MQLSTIWKLFSEKPMMQSFLNTLAGLSELFWKNYLGMQAVFSNFRNFKNAQGCYLKACNLLKSKSIAELFM